MSEFKYVKKAEGEVLRMTFEGAIDEDTKFPEIESQYKKVLIDLSGIRTINSVGIREWLHWIGPVSNERNIVLERCPKAIVFQFNMVEGFLPGRVQVSSFFVPYFCESCDREDNVLFTIGNEIKASGGKVQIQYDAPKGAECKKADCKLEMDVTESKYFQFLKRT